MEVRKECEFLKLFIITKDGEPYNHSNLKKETFVKAYYDKKVADKTAKGFCSAEANTYYRYGDGYYANENKNSLERKEMAKKLAEKEMDRWDVIEITL